MFGMCKEVGHEFTRMSTYDNKILCKDLSYKFVGLAMQVHNKLGFGFLEKVYENALMVLLQRERIGSKQQESITVYFENEMVGKYCTDILVENKRFMGTTCICSYFIINRRIDIIKLLELINEKC